MTRQIFDVVTVPERHRISFQYQLGIPNFGASYLKVGSSRNIFDKSKVKLKVTDENCRLP